MLVFVWNASEWDIVFLDNEDNLTKDDKMQIPEISREDIDDIDLLIQEKNDFAIPGNDIIFFKLRNCEKYL